MDEDMHLPDNSKPARADALRNRELLLETAQRLFGECGLENVTMTAVADAAGVGKGTLYRHFKNKAELIYALLDQDMLDLQQHILRRLEQNGDPVEDLHWFLGQVARFVNRNSRLLCTVARERGIPLLNAPAHLWWRQTIRGLLLRAASLPDPDYTADLIYIMLDAQTIHFQQETLGYDMPRILAGLDQTLDDLLN